MMNIIILFAIIDCTYMASNIGANDVASSSEDAANAFLPIVYN
jgi:phosphate/sulfate permease